MNLDLDRVGAVAGNLADHLGRATGDHLRHARATGDAHDPRQVDVAAQRRAGDDQLALALELDKRLVPLMDELAHFSSNYWMIQNCLGEGDSPIFLPDHPADGARPKN